MSGDVHVRFREHPRGRFPRVTRLVVLCGSAHEAQAALTAIQQWVQDNGLELNAQKTSVGDCRIMGQGFEFLGYRFEAGHQCIRLKSLRRMREEIRQRTRRTRSGSLRLIVKELNAVLRGWYAYFQHATTKTKFRELDSFVRRRLRAMLRRREKRPSHGHSPDDSRRWPNAYFAQQCLFAMYTARLAASQS